MRNYQTFDNFMEGYFSKRPEEIADYIAILFEECAEDGDMRPLLKSLRMLGRMMGITKIAEQTGLSRKGVQKALSDDGNPSFATINAIMHAMGYKLTPQPIDKN